MKRFKDQKIALKLMVYFTVFSAFMVIILGYEAIQVSTRYLTSQIESNCRIEATDHLTSIDILMDKYYHQINRFAHDSVFTGGNSTPEAITAFLKERKEIYNYASLSYFDMNRVRIADTDGLHIGEKYDLVGYWNDVLNGKISSGSDVRISEDLKIPVIFIASPVRNASGRATGVIVSVVNFEEIAYIINKTNIDNTHSTLFDKDRNILFSNCPEIEGSILKDKIEEIPSVNSALLGQDGVISEYSPYHKKEFITVYMHESGWQNFKGNNWFLIVSIEKEKVLTPIRELEKVIITGGILTMLAILFITFIIARLITRPIVELNKVMQNIKTGDLANRAHVDSMDEVGQLAAVFNQMIDSLKDSYDKIEMSHRELEEKVKERTKDLVDAQDKIVRSERLSVLGQFASGIAHELRNPLGVMKNVVYYINMLEPDKISPKIKDNLEILAKEIENSNNIISDLLEFSRIKKPVLRLENINAIVKETIARLKVPPDIEIIMELADDLPSIEVDPLQIQQVFYNIASNAIQSMEKGGRLTISSSVSVYVMINFQDTGKGIPKENLDKIFQPLYTTRPDGTGLGLAICASIIEGHSGRIEVKSEVGAGTKFTVKLPVERD